ncbi:MAG: hypothetical protein CBC19_04535 [Oceanospirillales bacterium TMED59]|nr:MAG: hypothetical protein CBC19_04535 [Oceanospirillales bacterium TMED59]
MPLRQNKLYLICFIILIKVFGIYFATNIFNNFSPLIDSSLYINESFAEIKDTRTKVVQDLVIFIKYFFSYHFLIHFIFAFISIIGFIYGILKKTLSPIIIFILILPSSLVWTSIVGKEAIFFGFFNLVIFIWFSYILGKLNTFDILLLIISIFVCFILRPHYSLVLLWMFFSVFIINNLFNYKFIILLPSFFLAFCFCFVYFYSDEILWRAINMIEYKARSSRFDLFSYQNPILTKESYVGIDLTGDLRSLKSHLLTKYKNEILILWPFSIIGPLPSELFERPEFFPFFIEGCLIFFFPIIIFVLAKKNKSTDFQKFYLYFCYVIIPSVIFLIIIHSPFGILNPGSGIRWRVNFETVFYLTTLLMYFNFKEKNKIANENFTHTSKC